MNIWGFGIAFFILGIVPVWFLGSFFGDIGFFMKVGLTLAMGIIIYIAVEYGGTKRGFITK